VQVNICQQRGYHAPLRASHLPFLPLPGFQYPGLEPFADQAEDHTVLHSLLQKVSQVLMVDRVEEGFDVQINDPATAHRRQSFPHRLDGVMR